MWVVPAREPYLVRNFLNSQAQQLMLGCSGDIDIQISHPDDECRERIFASLIKVLLHALLVYWLNNQVSQALKSQGLVTHELASDDQEHTKFMGICRLARPGALHRCFEMVPAQNLFSRFINCRFAGESILL